MAEPVDFPSETESMGFVLSPLGAAVSEAPSFNACEAVGDPADCGENGCDVTTEPVVRGPVSASLAVDCDPTEPVIAGDIGLNGTAPSVLEGPGSVRLGSPGADAVEPPALVLFGIPPAIDVLSSLEAAPELGKAVLLFSGLSI